jgi:hypothetical protein
MKKVNVLLALALLAAIGACRFDDSEVAEYGVPVRFQKGGDVLFPNFTICYVGERKVSSPVFKPGFTYYDFEVRGAKGTQTVSWSSGTGVIDSASFTVDGKPYELELRGSVAKKGWLRDDEMVVWPQADFLKALEARSKQSR